MKPVFTNRLRASFSALLCGLATYGQIVMAADPSPELPGIYKNIDVRLMTETLQALSGTKGESQGRIVQGIRDHPEKFAPPVLYSLSAVLFQRGDKDEAVFWFYAGQLRGRIDANISADPTARSVVDFLNQKYGPPIIQYSATNISQLTNTVARVLDWEENTPCRYDRRWINLHSVDAMTDATNTVLSVPPERWEAIRKRTRDEFRSNFPKTLEAIHENNP